MLVAQNSLGSVCPVPLTVRGKGPACKVDVTRHADVVLSMPPMRKGVHYVEINLGCVWCHTKVCFEGVGQFFWLEFTEQEIDELPPGAVSRRRRTR